MKLALGVFILCAGSCSDGSAGPDGPPAIDGVPAIDGAAATGPVSVTVRNADGTPAVGASVATQLVSGEVLMVASTGADGTAILQTVAGGSVTVGFDEEQDVKRLVTIMGVTFGQSVLFQARPPMRQPRDAETMTPPASPPTGTVGYVAQVPCRFEGQTVGPVASQALVQIFSDCVADGKYGAAITAVDAQGAALAYTFVDGVNLGSAPVFPPWMTDVTSSSLTITHAPPCATQCARLVPYRRTATNRRYAGLAQDLFFPVGPDVVRSISHAPSLPAPESGVVLTINLGFATAIVRHSTTDPPADDTVDLSQLLPQITAITADPTGPRLRMAFTAVAATHTPRAARFELRWLSAPDDGDVRFWTVLTPPPAGDAITLPLLPAELAAFAPVDSADFTASLTLVDDTAFASFAELAASDWNAEIGGYAPTRPGMRTVTLSSRP